MSKQTFAVHQLICQECRVGLQPGNGARCNHLSAQAMKMLAVELANFEATQSCPSHLYQAWL